MTADNRRVAALVNILLSTEAFSQEIIQHPPLRNYQIRPAQALIDAILNQTGLEFLWIFPRQSGKDEAIAQICAQLLTLLQRSERGHIVHVYPTGNQLATGLARLENRLKNRLTQNNTWEKGLPLRRGVGKAQVTFTSAGSRIEGISANALLIINETQDQDELLITRRFEPMRASTNATMLYVGTVRSTTDSYLWRVKTRLQKLEALDSIKRVYELTLDEVGLENPAYLKFVENQVLQKGREHPAIKTEYYNEPIDNNAGLFPERRRQLLIGHHRRLTRPQEGEIYLALIDIGGQDETPTTHDLWFTRNLSRDYTVVTIVRVRRETPTPPNPPAAGGNREGGGEAGGNGVGRGEAGGNGVGGNIGPVYEVVDVAVYQGARHFQTSRLRPSLFNQTMAFLRHWQVTAIISDQTGLGQGFTDALIEAYKRPVFGFTFSSLTKAALGNDFLALIETGRFTYFFDDHTRPGSDAWWFLIQAEYCTYQLAEGVPIERGLRWAVPDTARIKLSDTETVPVHDDRLVSAALCAEADRLFREGKLFLFTGESAVIEQPDLITQIDRGGWN